MDGGRDSYLPLLPHPSLFPAPLRPEKPWLSCTSYNRNTRSFSPPLNSPPSRLEQGLHGNGNIPVSSGSTVRISSKRAREDGMGERGRNALFRPGSNAAHPLSRSQCPPARTCKEALEREGTWDAYEFCFPYQGDSSLPRACLALTELPGVTFIPVCRKHVFHGWLHCIIITRRSFDQNNVISIVRSISPHTISPSPVHIHSLQPPGPCHPHRAHPSPAQNLMMCDTMSRKRERQEGLAKWMDVPLAITAFLTLCQCLPTTEAHKDAHAKIKMKSLTTKVHDYGCTSVPKLRSQSYQEPKSVWHEVKVIVPLL